MKLPRLPHLLFSLLAACLLAFLVYAEFRHQEIVALDRDTQEWGQKMAKELAKQRMLFKQQQEQELQQKLKQ